VKFSEKKIYGISDKKYLLLLENLKSKTIHSAKEEIYKLDIELLQINLLKQTFLYKSIKKNNLEELVIEIQKVLDKKKKKLDRWMNNNGKKNMSLR